MDTLRENAFYFFKTMVAVPVALLVLFWISLCPVSCKESDGGISFLRVEGCPSITSFNVTSASSFRISFDRVVNVQKASLRVIGKEIKQPLQVNSKSDGCDVDFLFSEPTVMGQSYALDAVVVDAHSNSLTVSLPFTSYNEHLAKLAICEVRNAYSSKTKKCEFIRLYCLESGNLSGLEVVSAGDGEEKKYAFPPIDIKKGQSVTVHLRKLRDSDGNEIENGMIDEVNGNITEAYATDASSSSWDFWVDTTKSRIAPSDILILRDNGRHKICDAFLFVDPKKESTSWEKKYLPFERAVAESGTWVDSYGKASASYSSAFVADGITNSAVTRTMIKSKPSHLPSSASDWSVKRKK